MAKPEHMITIVRGTVSNMVNYDFTYIPKLDEILIENTKDGHNMRLSYSQLQQVMDSATYTRGKYRKQ